MIIAADNSAQVSRVCQRLKCATSTATAALPVTSSEDLQALLTDAFSPSSLVLRKIILEVSPSDATDSEMEQKEIRTMQNLVADFDGVYTTAAAAPVLLEAFRVALVQRVLKSLGGASSAAAGSAMCPADRVRGDSLR